MTREERVRQGGIAVMVHWVGLGLVALATLGVWPPYGPWTSASIVGAFIFFAWSRAIRRNAIDAPDPDARPAEEGE